MSDLVDRITAVLRDSLLEQYYGQPVMGDTADAIDAWAAHVAERIEAAMREDGIVGFVRNDSHVKRRTYTDADAEVWSDQ